MMALVWLMVPGVGLFYSGLLRRKNALSMMFLSIAGVAVGSFQWFFWGYSLAFSETASAFIGDLKYFCLKDVLGEPSIGSTRLPALLFCAYQCMFAVSDARPYDRTPTNNSSSLVSSPSVVSPNDRKSAPSWSSSSAG